MASCTGVVGDVGPSRVPGSGGGGGDPTNSTIRRLTNWEYDNTIRDLLGDTHGESQNFVPDAEVEGFDNNASVQGVTVLIAEQLVDAAEAVADRAATDMNQLLGCDPGAVGEDICAADFIGRFGQRAWRRPLTSGEQDRLLTFYSGMKARYDFQSGIRLVVAAMLQSPHFLYRVELTPAGAKEDELVALDSWQIASRLSYLIWGSMPDDALFNAAAADELQTAGQIEAHARRMLDDPRARATVRHFAAQWLDLELLDMAQRSDPRWNPSLPGLLRDETETFFEKVTFDESGDLTMLLTSSHSYLNADLAAFYGVSGPSSTTFERFDFAADERAGFLTHASFLTVNARSDETSPVHRGKFVRTRLFCQKLPPPPNNVDTTLPATQTGVTTRDRLEQHSSDPACSGCHEMMDPIGFSFEAYDQIGVIRTEEQGVPIDASGELIRTDVDGAFYGAVELADRLASSDQVAECVRNQFFRFGYGRAESDTDAAVLADLDARFAAAGRNMQELLVALTQTQAFLYRPATPGDGSGL